MGTAAKPRKAWNRKWTKSKVLVELRQFFANSTQGSVPSLERDNQPLLGGARRMFGSLEAAMKAAGLPYPPNPKSLWTKSSLLTELRRRHADGQDLSYAAVKDRSNDSLLGPAIRRFGSWRKAVEAAGIPYTEVSRIRQWTPELVLDELRQIHARGENVGGGSIQQNHLPLSAAAKRYFGTYEKAALAAGIPLHQPAEEWSWPIDRLLETIRGLSDAGMDLSSGRIRQTHPGLFHACRRRIGSWQKAVEDAGLDYGTIRRAKSWTDERVLAELRRMHAQGVDLRPVVLQRQYVPLAGAVQRSHGTLKKAMEAAGLPYTGGTVVRAGSAHYTEQVVLQTLKDLHAEGYDLRYSNARRTQQPLFYAAERLFGSYAGAVKQAGIDYWEMSQEQLRRERERAVRKREVDEE